MIKADGLITTQNLAPAGEATPGSVVELFDLRDEGSVAVQVNGTYTGALTPYGRVNAKDWVQLVGLTNVTTGITVANIASGIAGIFRADVAGYEAFRLSADGAVTGAAAVTMRAGGAPSSVTDVRVSLEEADVEIGAVEVKDATTDNRLTVAADGRAAVDANLQVGNTDAPGGAGAVSASTPRVTLASDDPAVVGIGAPADAAATPGGTGSLSAKQRLATTLLDAIKTAAEIMDDWDESDRAKVNPIAGQAGVQGGAGAVTANTQRIVAASDDPGVAAVSVLPNADVTLLASAARTANANSADQTNGGHKGLHVVIDVTAIADSPSVVFTIEGKDAVSGKYYTLLASAAITGVGTTVLRVFPGLAAAANAAANDVLPRTWRVTTTHDDADSITYSVGASVIG